ncbi:hypothetical protein J4218_01285 [Candidatus Pacearchaeota archaeon]|nr:hypothetical protein [Candidatus Pacearchaeota archaeon]
MVQKLSPKGIGIALAAITFIISILCLLAVLLFGDASMKLFNLFFHGIDITSIKTTANLVQGLIGTVIITIIGYFVGWIFAIVYNKYSN